MSEGWSDGEEMAMDSDYEYDGDEDEGIDEEKSSWLTDHYKTKRWEAKEAELRREMESAGESGTALALQLRDKTAGGLGCVTGESAPRNMFSGAASFKVLAADLLALQRAAEARNSGEAVGPRGVHVEADAVDDNVYHWRVRLSRFPPGSPAQTELGRLERGEHMQILNTVGPQRPRILDQ